MSVNNKESKCTSNLQGIRENPRKQITKNGYNPHIRSFTPIIGKAEEIKLIENYFEINPENKKQIIVNSGVIDEILKELSNIISLSDINQIENLCDKHVLAFKKENLFNFKYPFLINYFKPNLTEMFKTVNQDTTKVVVYLHRLMSLSSSMEDKLIQIYSKSIKSKEFGISELIKGSITTQVKYTQDVSGFLDTYAIWYAQSEIAMFNFYLLNLVFDTKFEFVNTKFSIENNYHWSVDDFGRRNFARLSSLILKNIDIGMNIFGPVNYAGLSMMLMSGYYAGMSLTSLFKATSYCHYAIIGSYVFNYLVGIISKALDSYSDTFYFRKVTALLKKLNDKLNKITTSTKDLIELLIMKELTECFTRNNQTQSLVTNYSKELLNSKVEEIKMLLQKHILKTDDLSDKELIEIEVEATKWVERSVSVYERNEKNEKETEINGQSFILVNEDNEPKNKDDWLLISLIKMKSVNSLKSK